MASTLFHANFSWRAGSPLEVCVPCGVSTSALSAPAHLCTLHCQGSGSALAAVLRTEVLSPFWRPKPASTLPASRLPLLQSRSGYAKPHRQYQTHTTHVCTTQTVRRLDGKVGTTTIQNQRHLKVATRKNWTNGKCEASGGLGVHQVEDLPRYQAWIACVRRRLGNINNARKAWTRERSCVNGVVLWTCHELGGVLEGRPLG